MIVQFVVFGTCLVTQGAGVALDHTRVAALVNARLRKASFLRSKIGIVGVLTFR